MTKTAFTPMRALRLIAVLGCAALSALAAPAAFAQALRGPIKVLVGFPPGGGTDAAARVYADALKDTLGVNVVVENKPGAGG
jgi:tripartite-type tricarboxylate transporter receptor subunit TctC